MKALKFLLASSFLFLPCSAALSFIFDDTGGVDQTEELDGGGVGASVMATSGTLTATLTTVDILFPEYDESSGTPVATGNILSAATGEGGTTNIGGNQDSLGINHPTLNTGDWSALGGDGSESADFNTGESWVFEFDVPITFNEIEFEAAITGNIFEVLVDGASIVSLNGPDEVVSGAGLGGLDGLTIPAGSDISFAASGPLANTSFRIESFNISVVPEPSSSLFLALGGLLLLARRWR